MEKCWDIAVQIEQRVHLDRDPCVYGTSPISQALAVGQLSECHGQKLLPA
jgi:hypothetical protein